MVYTNRLRDLEVIIKGLKGRVPDRDLWWGGSSGLVLERSWQTRMCAERTDIAGHVSTTPFEGMPMRGQCVGDIGR